MEINLIGAFATPHHLVGVEKEGIFMMLWQCAGVKLPKDMNWFKGKTRPEHEGEITGVAMGWNTWISLGMRPLPGRRHFILTKSHQLEWNSSPENLVRAVAYSDLGAIIDAAEQMGLGKLSIIGGPALWLEALPFADQAFITLVEHHFEVKGRVISGRAFMDALESQMVSLEPIFDIEETPIGKIPLRFCTWKRK